MFGNPSTTTGGNALKFYASQRMEIRRTGGVKGKDDLNPIGNTTLVKVIKNKVAPPFRQAEFNIIYGKGIDLYTDLLNTAVEEGIAEKNGTWYSYGDTRLGQGEGQSSAFLEKNPEIATEIRDKLQNG